MVPIRSKKPSIPDYGKSMREMLKLYNTKRRCEICGTRRELYKFVRKPGGRLYCLCSKHLSRRVKK